MFPNLDITMQLLGAAYRPFRQQESSSLISDSIHSATLSSGSVILSG